PTAAPAPTATPSPSPVPSASPTPPPSQTDPVLPLSTVDTALPVVTGTVISVPSGGDLQAALDQAQPGDAVELQAAAVFAGTYVLRQKTPPPAGALSRLRAFVFGAPAPPKIWIRSSSAALPAQGIRVDPGQAPAMAKLLTTNQSPALSFQWGASNY